MKVVFNVSGVEFQNIQKGFEEAYGELELDEIEEEIAEFISEGFDRIRTEVKIVVTE